MKILLNIYKYLPIVLLLGGCQKSLNLTPKDQISDASFWQRPEDFELAATDFYYGLREVPSTGSNNADTRYVDNNADISFGSGANAVSNGSFLPQATSPIWDIAYKQIRGTNYLLAKAQESGLGTALDRWVGEALFFRAYNYYRLLLAFGGVPKIDKVLEVTSPELYTPKASQKEIMDFLLGDLESAIDKLPKQSDLGEAEIGRVTQGAALALRARAALYMGTWARYHNEGDAAKYIDIAIDAADKVITSGEYGLYEGKGADSYKYLFILQGDDSREVILARRYYANRITHNWTRELWFNAMVPTKNLADMYLSKDGLPTTKSSLFQGYSTLTSEFQDRDPRMAMTFIVPGSTIFFEGGIWQPTFPGFTGTNATRTGYMLRKFLDETIEAATFLGAYDFKEFRYGEVLLILAEALYEKNGAILDQDLNRTINVLRKRVNMPALTNAFVSANGLNMLDEIRRERTVELAFEGFRRDDLRRWKTAETTMPQAIRGVKFTGTAYQQRYPDLRIGTDIQVDNNGFIIAEPAASRHFLPKHYLDPLPLQQIQLSHQTLVQNTGW
ncbi:RagB/SusD family nutrient uptake outer membrane protein [Chitinophaga sp. MM2321]|uniref:RagB/SusD family nutrient uptake outer membrane protein n=1 Tax=Chitinophaga sp. MM2321 TaxID=3137178 RepID=UPI0032D58080